MVRRLTQASPRHGIEAWAYCLAEGRLAQTLREEGLPLRVFPSCCRFDIRAIGALARAIRRDRIELIQAHTSRTHLIARLLAMRLGIPNITTIHSPIALDENRGFSRHPWRARIERLGRRWTDHICTVSREETERLAREEGVPRDKLSWIPNAVLPTEPLDRDGDRARLRQWLRDHNLADDRFTVAMVAQMRPRKGPEVLLRAFGRWLRDGGQGLLLMIGDDEMVDGSSYLEGLRTLCRQLGIDAAVHFTGFLDSPWELAAGADLIALPSLFGEGQPLVLIEAMNHGVAIAVSDTAGNRETVVTGQTGWLHAPGDDAALARHIAEAAADPAATLGRGDAGRRFCLERFTIDHVMPLYRELYLKLVGARHTHP